MEATIDRLTRIMPPPANPVAATGDWAATELALGVTLPADYKDFITIYGLGRIGNHLWINSPFHEEYNLQGISSYHCQNLRDYADQKVLNQPLPPLYPEPGGWLSFGSTENSYYLGWTTEGPPSQWTVSVFDMDFMEFRPARLATTLGQFLLALLDKSSEYFASGCFTALTTDPIKFKSMGG